MNQAEIDTKETDVPKKSFEGVLDNELVDIINVSVANLEPIRELERQRLDQIWDAIMALSRDALISIQSVDGQSSIVSMDDDNGRIHNDFAFTGTKTYCPATPEYIGLYWHKTRTFIRRKDLGITFNVTNVETQPSLSQLDN